MRYLYLGKKLGTLLLISSQPWNVTRTKEVGHATSSGRQDSIMLLNYIAQLYSALVVLTPIESVILSGWAGPWALTSRESCCHPDGVQNHFLPRTTGAPKVHVHRAAGYVNMT